MEEDSKPEISQSKTDEQVTDETKKTDQTPPKPKENEPEKPAKTEPPKKDKMEIDPKVLKDQLGRTEKMKKQIKDLNNKETSLQNQLNEKSRLLEESNKIQVLSQEVLDGKCKALQNILDDTSNKNEELTNKLKDAELSMNNVKRENIMMTGELKYFTEKYKDEFPKDRRISELEALVKRLQSDNDKLKNESKISQQSSSRIIQENQQIKMDQKRENEYKDLIKKLEEENTKFETSYNELQEKHTNMTEELFEKIDNFERENRVQSSDQSQTKTEQEDLENNYKEFYDTVSELDKKTKKKNEELKHDNAAMTSDITEYSKRTKKLEEELAQMMHKMRSMPRSGGAGYADKNEKIIVESLSLQNNELVKENRKFERDSKKYEMMAKEFENVMNFRQNSLMIVIDELIKQEDIKFKELRKNIKEEEEARIYNARNNKSQEDLKEMIERIIIQNIELKKEKTILQAKAITKKMVVVKKQPENPAVVKNQPVNPNVVQKEQERKA